MSNHNLGQTLVFTLFCFIYARVCYKAALWIRRQQRYDKNSTMANVLGLSRGSLDGAGLLIAIVTGIGLAPLLPLLLAISCWYNREAYILHWQGWASISLVGLVYFIAGAYRGKIYIQQYWAAIESVKMEEIISSDSGGTIRVTSADYGKFQDFVLDLTFKGIDAPVAIVAAKAFWRDDRHNHYWP